MNRLARIPSACLECNQAIEILIDNSWIETVIRAEENRRRNAEKNLKESSRLLKLMAEALGKAKQGLESIAAYKNGVFGNASWESDIAINTLKYGWISESLAEYQKSIGGKETL